MNPKHLRDLHWTFPAWAAFLGALGGWCCKWLRRYLLPASGGLLALAYGVRWHRALLYALATSLAFSLPYSPERHSWLVIGLVGASYGATPLLLLPRQGGWTWAWPGLLAGWLVALLALSAHVDWFMHKWIEMLVFGAHGWLVARAIERHQGSWPTASTNGAGAA